MHVPRLLALFSLLLSLPAIAQTAPAFDLTVPPDHLRIPVLVTDKQGRPVSGLRVDDFRVFDNGKPAVIDTFLALSTTSPSPVHFTVFYLDDRHLSAEQMNSARQAVAAALPAALESDGYAAIVTGTGSANSGFSRNPDQLRQSLDSIRTTTFAAVGTHAHNFDLIGTYNSLAEYASRMSKLPGRRLLVILSPGFSDDFPEIRFAAAISIGRIIQSGAVINALYIQGPASITSTDRIGLEELCSATGGSFFSNSSHSPALTHYPELLYLLDTPLSAVRADGSSHQLKITVSHPGSRLRARESFVAPKSSR